MQKKNEFEVGNHSICALSSVALLVSRLPNLHGYFHPMKATSSAPGLLNASTTENLVGTAKIFHLHVAVINSAL